MLTPDEWATRVIEKIRERESSRQPQPETVTYDSFDHEMNELWLRTRAVFDEYLRALSRNGIVLHWKADPLWFEITRSDSEKRVPLLVQFSAHSLFHDLELRLADRTHRFPVRMTKSGLELLSEDEESRTSPEEIAANALEHLLMLGEQ
jgi:hypothetical protein